MQHCTEDFLRRLSTYHQLRVLRLAFDIVLDLANKNGLECLTGLQELTELELWAVFHDIPDNDHERLFIQPAQEAFKFLQSFSRLTKLTTNWELRAGDFEHFCATVPLPQLFEWRLLAPLHVELAIPKLTNAPKLASLTVQPVTPSQCCMDPKKSEDIKMSVFAHLPALTEIVLLYAQHQSRMLESNWLGLKQCGRNNDKRWILQQVKNLHTQASAIAVSSATQETSITVSSAVEEAWHTTCYRDCDCPHWKPLESLLDRFKYAPQPIEQRFGRGQSLERGAFSISRRPAGDGVIFRPKPRKATGKLRMAAKGERILVRDCKVSHGRSMLFIDCFAGDGDCARRIAYYDALPTMWSCDKTSMRFHLTLTIFFYAAVASGF